MKKAFSLSHCEPSAVTADLKLRNLQPRKGGSVSISATPGFPHMTRNRIFPGRLIG